MGAANCRSSYSDLNAGVNEPYRNKLQEEKKLFLVCKSTPLPPIIMPGALEPPKEPKKEPKSDEDCLELNEKFAAGHEGEDAEDKNNFTNSGEPPTMTEADIKKIHADATISHVEKAVKFARQAVLEDNKGNYETAAPLYSCAVKYFLHALIVENARPLVRQIQEKLTVYIKRSVRLKTYLIQKRTSEGIKTSFAVEPLNDSYSLKEEDPLSDQIKGSILKERPNVKWTDVAGLDDAKGLLNETLIMPIKFPQLFASNRGPWKGILLYGLRGTGKTFLAKAAAAEAKTHTVFSLKPSNLIAKWLGESEKLPKHLFDMARKLKPSIIFIDEIDSLCTSDPRGTATLDAVRRMIKEFMLNLKGMDGNSDGILVLGATCCPWKLDDNLLSLFEKKIYIPLPDEQARLSILKENFLGFPHTLKEDDFKRLAEKTDGYSGEEIIILVKDASLIPVRKIQKATHFVKVSGPLRSDPNVTVDDLYTPCSESQAGAKEMNLMDIPGDRLLEPNVTLDDVLLCLENSRPADKQEDVKEMEKFMESIGQKSSDI